MPTVYSANKSNVLIDGEVIEGLQSITFRVNTEREDIKAIGSSERVDVSFGLRTVLGEVCVRSTASLLDSHLEAKTPFQLVASLKKGDGSDSPSRTYSFDDCYVEGKGLNMETGGTALTVYNFTATRVREE